MFKKWLTLILAIAMVFTFGPSELYAKDISIQENGNDITYINKGENVLLKLEGMSISDSISFVSEDISIAKVTSSTWEFDTQKSPWTKTFSANVVGVSAGTVNIKAVDANGTVKKIYMMKVTPYDYIACPGKSFSETITTRNVDQNYVFTTKEGEQVNATLTNTSCLGINGSMTYYRTYKITINKPGKYTLIGTGVVDLTQVSTQVSIGHTPGEDYVIDEKPNCSMMGSKSIHCVKCQSIIEETKETIEVDSDAHDYESPEFTWTEDGKSCKVKYTCKNDALHFVEYDAEVTSTVKKEATCEKNGTTIFTAKYGSDTAEKELGDILALGHDYSEEWTVDKEATCTEKGSKSHHCSRCESKKDDTEIPATGHNWDVGKVTTEPTCEKAGVKTYECQTCHTTKTESIDALGHDYSEEWTVDKEATCTEKGSKSHHCSRCESKDCVTEIEFKSHNFKTVITKATTSKNGSIISKCTACGKVNSSKTIYYPKTISISKTSYIYNGKVQKPTVTVKGSDGKTIATSNYKVTYSNGCKNAGKYTVMITFKGNYSGSVSKTYMIVPKGTTIKSLTAGSKKITVKWTKQLGQTTGYQIQYSTSRKFTSSKTITVSKNSTVSATISKLSGSKKYYVRIRTYKTVSGTKYYSAWSSTKYVKTKK